MDSPTACGAITIRTADGTPIGHGWGEVRVRRDPGTGRAGAFGEVRTMTWLADLPPPGVRHSYEVRFHGGLSFVAVFDGAFPDTSRQRATFRPSDPTTVPTGSRRGIQQTASARWSP
jgi:hypothetical protein